MILCYKESEIHTEIICDQILNAITFGDLNENLRFQAEEEEDKMCFQFRVELAVNLCQEFVVVDSTLVA